MENNVILAAIKKRRGVRRYKNKPVSNVVVESIVNAGLFAPFAGDQQCRFSVIMSRRKIEHINRSAKETARSLGVPHLTALGESDEFDCSYGAPVLIIISARESAIAPEMDAAAAAENILIAAESFELGSCWAFFPTLAFFGADESEMKREYAIEEPYKPYVAICIGYADESPDAPTYDDNRVMYIN